MEKKLLPLPIGVSDFKKIVSGYYYVDKTLLIKELLDARPQVSLFTRPRRFGKTLAMDMLKTFFEKTDMDTSKYFETLNIWNCGEEYRLEQGKYPVIFITFKDIKYNTWEQAREAIHDVIAREYRRHIYILESGKVNEYDKKYFRSILEGMVTEVGLSAALQNLSYMLDVHYGESAIIIVDEYDTPIQQGYTFGYYDEVVRFVRNLLSGAFKDNASLAYGFLTGILRVAKESIFSGLNNLTVNSIVDDKYTTYFGFDNDEIDAMTLYYGVADKKQEICDWYDGYRFGNDDIFNPWSVINYFYNNCVAKTYWQSTGDNSIIRQIVSNADADVADNLRKLMQGEIISAYIDTSVIYPEIKNNPMTIYSFLLVAGYLKVLKKEEYQMGNYMCRIAIPNKEIAYVYQKEVISALSDVVSQSVVIELNQAVLDRDTKGLQKYLGRLLLDTISSFDYAHENFYHGLMLGICAIMNDVYRLESNREAGHGRYDIQMMPIAKRLPGIIIELKVVKEVSSENNIDEKLEQMASNALLQIDDKKYDAAMKKNDVTEIMKIGVAFYKKHVKLVSRVEKADENTRGA